MIYQILISLFAVLGVVMVLLILIQKGKSSMGLGGLGGGTQLLFGGSGGQDLFQKITWALGAIFMASSLILAMVKRPGSSELLGSLARTQQAPVMPKMPQAAPAKAAEPTPESSQATGQAEQTGAQS